MKNLVKISLFAIALIAVSCNKEVIKPNTSTQDEIFVQKSASNANPGFDRTNGGSGITDPNNDPDMIIKKAVVIKPN